MTAEIIDETMVIKAENESETLKLKEWRKRRKQPKKRWLEVRYYPNIQVLVI
jgi:hypothetical protein